MKFEHHIKIELTPDFVRTALSAGESLLRRMASEVPWVITLAVVIRAFGWG